MQTRIETTYEFTSSDSFLVVPSSKGTAGLLIREAGNIEHEIRLEFHGCHAEALEKLAAIARQLADAAQTPMSDDEIRRCEDHQASLDADRLYQEMRAVALAENVECS